jgi:uncharacterized glyoxalase superfamily protein PhnB
MVEAGMSTVRPPTVRELVPLLFVQDIERSVAFYRNGLGFEVCARWAPDGKLAWCRIQRDASAVMLQQASEEDGPAEGRGRGTGFFFICDDVDALYSELSARGVQVGPPQVAFYGMKQIFMADPDGYELCFETPVGAAGRME